MHRCSEEEERWEKTKNMKKRKKWTKKSGRIWERKRVKEERRKGSKKNNRVPVQAH